MVRTSATWLIFCLAASAASAAHRSTRPNILWIVVDDMSANFSCYGETTIRTPHVDRLAEGGMRFTRAFVTCPVCSPCRSALITGCYQTSIGAHHHRSGRGVETIPLPPDIEPVPVLFRRAGYFTCIGGPLVAEGTALGKTDYNFQWDPAMYDANDWAGREAGQPFFMQVQLHGGKYRGNNRQKYDDWVARVRRELGSSTPVADVTLPPYYPRDPVLVEDWALYLDSVRYTDKEVGEVLSRLEREGILDETVVFFITDHGISHARGKQFLYDEGLHVPLVVRGPGIDAGQVRGDLVQQIDLAPTALALAGIEIPSWMQGRNVLSPDYEKRTAIFAARDRCDETVDHLRAVRSEQFKYIRNYLPNRPHLQPNAYKDGKFIVERLRELHAAGRLNELCERLLFAPTRPTEELYDLASDPHELSNLAGLAQYQQTLVDMRQRLSAWEEQTNDRGRVPESAAMYDSDMAVYVGDRTGRRDVPPTALERNIALMKRWAQEGK